jgi:hypothetical protein
MDIAAVWYRREQINRVSYDDYTSAVPRLRADSDGLMSTSIIQ